MGGITGKRTLVLKGISCLHCGWMESSWQPCSKGTGFHYYAEGFLVFLEGGIGWIPVLLWDLWKETLTLQVSEGALYD